MRAWFLLPLLLAACGGPLPSGTGGEEVLLLGYQSPEQLEAALGRVGGMLEGVEPRLRVAQVRLPQGLSLEGAAWRLRGLGLRFVEAPGERDYRPLPPEGGLAPLAGWAWHLEAVRAEEAWAQVRGRGVRVAVGDGGLDETHPALRDRVVGVYDPRAGELPPGEDRSGLQVHGTHVAGLVAGRGVGVAPEAGLLSLILFQPDYVGDFLAAQALLWAVDRGARVVNLSFGGYAYSQTLHEAVNYALERLVVVVAAAGNQGTGLRYYPAALPGVVAVGALDGRGEAAWFSNQGPWVHLWAPGVRIYSTFPEGGYGLLSGTSMAAPIAAGLAALLKERYPFAEAYAIRRRLQAAPGPDAVVALSAPDPGRGACLRLQVQDSSGRPVLGRVALQGPEEHWALLNALGETAFFQVAPGPYRLRVWTEGGLYWSETLDLTYSCILPRRVVLP